MAPKKRTSGSIPTAKSKKAKQPDARQPTIGAMLAMAGERPAPPLVQLERGAEPRPALDRRLQHEIESKAEKYKAVWADKCERRLAAERALAGAARSAAASGIAAKRTREELDLDQPGLLLLDCIHRALQHGSAAGAVLEPGALETLVLLCRNDCVHAHPEVSHQAFRMLRGQLARHPYASVATPEDGPAAGRPQLVVCESAAWMPLHCSADSFTARRLLLPDMVASGSAHLRAQQPGKSVRIRDETPPHDRFPTPFHMLLHFFKAALQSDELDRNGDLLLLRYQLDLLAQDARCRLRVFRAWQGCEEALQGRRAALLTSSLLWRVCGDQGVSTDDRQGMVTALVRLIVGLDDDSALREVEESEEELEGVPLALAWASSRDQASACAFTQRELASMAARFLNLQLEVFGAAEDAGLFHAPARVRASERKNLRMQLDAMLQRCFWGDASVCKTDDTSRALLAALAPRDRLRFLGLLVAAKHVRTWESGRSEERAHVAADPHVAADQLEGLKMAAWLLEHGTDADGFVEPCAWQVVRSINLDFSRALKVYATINHLTVVVASVALGVHALLATSGPSQRLTCLADGASALPTLREELAKALRSIAERSRGAQAMHKLSPTSVFDLVHAQMALATLSAAT